MNVPNTFNIQYMYRGKENDYFHRVSECFLKMYKCPMVVIGIKHLNHTQYDGSSSS